MEPESSIPHSLAPSSFPYPEQDQSRPASSTQFSNIRFNIIIPYTPRSSKWSLSIRFLQQTLYLFLFSVIHTTYPIHLHVFGLIAQIISDEEIKSWRPLLRNFSLDSLVSIKFSWHRGYSVSYMQKECMTETIFLNLQCCLPWLYFIDKTRHKRVHILEWEGEFLTYLHWELQYLLLSTSLPDYQMCWLHLTVEETALSQKLS